MGMDFRCLQVWKQVWEMTLLAWNRVRIWRTGFHSPTKNSQEYPWGQITSFSLIKQWKISWITWSRAIADWWTLGKLPFLVYKGMRHCTGYGFCYLCPKQVIQFRVRLSTGYRTIARWRHFTTTTRILEFVVFLCKLRPLFFNPQRDWQI